MKAVLISIKPKFSNKILSGEKNVELRKSVPKIPLPFRAYIYCTAGKDTLVDIIKDGDDVYGEVYHGKPIFIKYDRDCPSSMLCRKKMIVGEMMIDRIEEVTLEPESQKGQYGGKFEESFTTCITVDEFKKYSEKGKVYGWHISAYAYYKEPRPLSDFGLKHPPQSWRYVEEITNED